MKSFASTNSASPKSNSVKRNGVVILLILVTALSAVPLFGGAFVGFGFSHVHGHHHVWPGYRYGYGHFYYGPYYRPYSWYYPSYSFFYAGPFYYPLAYYDGPVYAVYRPRYRMSYRDSQHAYSTSERTAWLRLDIQPRRAAVYIDGRYAGRADEFANGKKLLPVSAADHTLRIEAEGYQTAVVDLKINPLQTLDITQRLAEASRTSSAGSAAPPSSSNPARESKRIAPPLRQPYLGQPAPRSLAQGKASMAPRNEWPPAPQAPTDKSVNKAATEKAEGAQFGRIIVKFDKATQEAAVYIDGRLIGETDPSNPEFMVNDVPAGTHTVEVTKPGFEDFRGEVAVRSNQTSTLKVVLRQQAKK